jgi:hypothetical protein
MFEIRISAFGIFIMMIRLVIIEILSIILRRILKAKLLVNDNKRLFILSKRGINNIYSTYLKILISEALILTVFI